MSFTEEQEQEVVAAYRRGDKLSVIHLDYKLSSYDLYRILRKNNVLLRSQDPNHPASSMKTRRAAITQLREGTVEQKVEIVNPEIKNADLLDWLKRIDSKLIEMDGNIYYLTEKAVLDPEMKVDIVSAYLSSHLYNRDRDLARQIINVIEALTY